MKTIASVDDVATLDVNIEQLEDKLAPTPSIPIPPPFR
jgi:hypothetical protein